MHFTSTVLAALSLTLTTAHPAQQPLTKEPILATKPSYDAYKGPGKYIIQNEATGTVMDLVHGMSAAGTAIAGWTKAPNDHQIWQILEAGPNQFQIVNAATGATASCPVLAAAEWYRPMVGGPVPVDGNSLFTMVANDNKSVQFKSVANTGLCIDLKLSKSEDDTPILCWTCRDRTDDNANQSWLLLAQ